nr:aromatic acid exporter family protein [Tissierella sp.]
MKKIKDLNFLLLLKTGIGSAIAIILANRFNLLYSASAGIITLLTIQNTKIETISIALKRIAAFFIAVAIAFAVFNQFGYSSASFGAFIFIFVAICNLLGLQDGISMNAVLTTHFLIEKRMDAPFILNEISLLIIGMGIGIVINLIMPKNMDRIKKEQEIIETKMKDILKCISCVLKGKKECLACNDFQEEIDIKDLERLLNGSIEAAYQEAGNTLLTETRYQISYLEMRKLQLVALKDIFKNIQEINGIIPQSIRVSRYIEKVADEFHELNNVKALMSDLEELYESFRKETLPKTREEFENRAILFNILSDIERFLQIKRSFIIKEEE